MRFREDLVERKQWLVVAQAQLRWNHIHMLRQRGFINDLKSVRRGS